MLHADQGAWEILWTFASSEMTLPEAEECLKKKLGNQYIVDDWKSALDAVMNVEGDVVQAQEALHKLASECQLPHLTIKLPHKSPPKSATIPQITEAEQELMESVKELVKCRQIIGSPPTLEDLINPVEEREIGDSPYRFEGGDAEIVAVVQHEMAVARGDVIELEDSEDDAEDDVEDVPT